VPDAASLITDFVTTSPEAASTAKWLLLGGILSLAPALAVMTTSFVRIAVVLGIVKQGFGGGQFLPPQAMMALSLFLTVGVMAPVWRASYDAGYAPYANVRHASPAEQQAALTRAFENGAAPIRKFMALQIEAAGNTAAVDLILKYQSQWKTSDATEPRYYEDLPLSVLLPAYVLSELKIAFAIGFQLLLPFVVIDIVVASLINSLGVVSLSAAWASFPLKLLLFVLIDGWLLTVETLLGSIRPFTS
jgi:flagellar biosynthetic protein FliP